jgi:hypothetical protein
MSFVEVVKEIILPFWSMRPDHKCVIHIMATASGLEGHPVECHIKILHEEVGNSG